MARMVSVEVMMGLGSGILEKCVVIGHDRSLAKGLKTVNESRVSHVHTITPMLNRLPYAGTSVTSQGGTSSVMAENFRAVLLAGMPGKVAPRLMRT